LVLTCGKGSPFAKTFRAKSLARSASDDLIIENEVNVDAAPYLQGFASGCLDQDAYSLRLFANAGVPMMLCQSFAKNMGLYGERTGALHVICGSAEEAKRVESQVKGVIRPMYSSPPRHGAAIAATILSDEVLFAEWRRELKMMADRINAMRQVCPSSDSLTCHHVTQVISLRTQHIVCGSVEGPTRVEGQMTGVIWPMKAAACNGMVRRSGRMRSRVRSGDESLR
jgi:hypothetical protein